MALPNDIESVTTFLIVKVEGGDNENIAEQIRKQNIDGREVQVTVSRSYDNNLLFDAGEPVLYIP